LKSKFLYIIIFSVFANTAIKAQEVLTALSKNPVLTNQVDNSSLRSTKGVSKEIHLPMREDFSSPSFIPNQDYWATKSVFINNSYPVNPPSIGVATFDAMDENGAVYAHMGAFPAIADTFTTNNIRLDSLFGSSKTKLNPSDSVYLSFYVQPQGIGAAPLSGDSLVLQFYDANTSLWNSVWNIDGMSLDTFRVRYDTSFKQVLIPIKDPKYFTSEFKFRFYNYARVPSADKPSWRSGLHAHWNIDYIILDTNRSFNDTINPDVAIYTQPSSLLKDYQSTTWKQYQAGISGAMEQNRAVKFSNHDKITKNVAKKFFIYDLWNKTVSFSTATSSINTPGHSSLVFAPDYSAYNFTSSAPKYPEFRVLYHVSSNTGIPDIIKANDTAFFYQNFYNYISYDDGIPEAGYGLSTPNGKLAYKFTLNTADTLQSVEMYFNQTIGNANQRYFYLTVWDDNNGKPGNVIYEKSGKRPEFESNLFKYHTYTLDQELPLSSGTFYIGWRQTTKDNLNIGFDLASNNSNKIFYNVSGQWYNSSFKGSLMIRPILGQEKHAHVGFVKPKATEKISINIYPNPNNTGIVNIDINDNSLNSNKYYLSIFSMQGQIVFEGNYKQKINLQHLTKGVYIVKIMDKHNNINIIKKLILN